MLHSDLGAGVKTADRLATASAHLGAVASGFSLSFDTAVPTGAVRPGSYRRHHFLSTAVSDPSYLLQVLLENG